MKAMNGYMNRIIISFPQIFPLFVGELANGSFSKYILPAGPDISVGEVELKAQKHLNEQALGSPLVPNRTIQNVLDVFNHSNGYFLEGAQEAAFEGAADKIMQMCHEIEQQRVAEGSVLSAKEKLAQEREHFEEEQEKMNQELLEEDKRAERLQAELEAQRADFAAQLAAVKANRK